jgi:hypothetical protein
LENLEPVPVPVRPKKVKKPDRTGPLNTKHIEELKQAITVIELFLLRMNRKRLTGHVGGSRESINYRRWMVGRYYKDGISWDDSALDRCDRGKVEVESGDGWLQGYIRRSLWRELRKICSGIGYHGWEAIKGMTFDYILCDFD